MVKYMHQPKNKLTLGSTALTNYAPSVTITRIENGFDTATISLPDKKNSLYPSTVTNGTTFQFDVKDDKETDYTTICKGIVRFPILETKDIQLKCDGSGYGLGDTVCVEEYGSQSGNPTLDTITEIITDATNGILAKYVTGTFGGTSSGFSYSSIIANIANVIPYIYFPYKPCNKTIDDLCDLVTALQAGSAGPHWIVTTDDTLHLKLVGNSQTGWSKYYGGTDNTAEQATLVQGKDFTDFRFEPIGSEANLIVYSGSWRRPSNGDFWTENQSSLWDTYTGYTTLSDDNTNYIVGLYSLKAAFSDFTGTMNFHYPADRDASWDFNKWADFNIPTLNFYIRRSNACTRLDVALNTVSGSSITGSYYKEITSDVSAANKWFHFSLPIGPYATLYNDENFSWSESGTPNWADIDEINFRVDDLDNAYVCVDGLHFGGAPIIRIAKNSTNITANKLKVKVITDNIGKDDSLKATDDSGLMAQMAYAELLRLQKSALTGSITTPMLKDALPGQYFHIHAKPKYDGTFTIDKDMRATKIIHNIQPAPVGYTTTIELTDDLTNSHPRPSYEDRNKIAGANRPEYQDRQAASIKAGEIDIRITALTKDYPS
ncbi:MAG: hypothetical protein WC325_12030 [Candidatus Bathyarchaeia archaeon]